MNKPTIEQIEDVLKQRGMKMFTSPYSVTLGGIRTNDNQSNKFNDWIFAHYYDRAGNSHYQIEKGTTDAGLYYRLNPISISGTAIIQHGVQHRSCYELQNPKIDGKRGHKGQKAFKQVGNMIYWRDANRDSYLDFNGVEQVGIFATNGHYMSNGSLFVNKWSAGCWGSTIEIMDKIYAIAEVQIENGLGNKFSFALLHEKHFKNED